MQHSDDDRSPVPPPIEILLVEDHPDTAKFVQILLERRGYRVKAAHTYSGAMELATAHQFDVVVADILLPDGSGHDLMRWLAHEQSISGIAISGLSEPEDIEQSIGAGFLRHLVKPINTLELYTAIDQIANRER